MSKLAIDVVLLPSDEMSQRAITISQALADSSGNQNIVLNTTDYRPHISLCMGVISAADLNKVIDVLRNIAETTMPFELVAQKQQSFRIPTGEDLAVIPVEDNPPLLRLHKDILASLKPFTSSDAEPHMFYGSRINPISCTWVNGYRDTQFFPHITTGFGTLQPQQTLPAVFTSTRLALFQLGNYCTCRKKLAEFDLHTA